MKKHQKSSATPKILLVIFISALVAVSFLFAKQKVEEFCGTSDLNGASAYAPTDSADDSSWQLMLVNADHPLPEGFSVELTTLANGHKVDKRVYPYLQRMFDDARSAGIIPAISSSYRTAEKQQSILDEYTEQYINQGYSEAEALEIAKTWAAVPGTSEHQTGLALDITTADANKQAADIVWKWLKKNSYKYGFIIRYPEDKTDITGISNEPWHFRYVGEKAAAEIHKKGLCLEEYLNLTE